MTSYVWFKMLLQLIFGINTKLSENLSKLPIGVQSNWKLIDFSEEKNNVSVTPKITL